MARLQVVNFAEHTKISKQATGILERISRMVQEGEVKEILVCTTTTSGEIMLDCTDTNDRLRRLGMLQLLIAQALEE